jgi:hypothetical protein
VQAAGSACDIPLNDYELERAFSANHFGRQVSQNASLVLVYFRGKVDDDLFDLVFFSGLWRDSGNDVDRHLEGTS